MGSILKKFRNKKRPVCSLKKMTNKNDNKLQKSKNANKENVELESKTTSSDSTSLASSTSDELPLQTRAVSPPYDFKWNELKEQNSFFKFSQFDEELEAFNQERLSRKAEANTKSNYHRNLRSKKDVPKKNKIPEIDMQKERGLLFGAITNHAELPNASGNKFPHLSPFEFRSLASLKQTPIQCHDVRAPEAIRSSPVSFSRWDNAFVNQKQKEVFIRITSSFEFVPHHISVTRGTFINWILDDDVMGVCEFSLVGVESNHSSSNYFLPVVFRSYVLQKKCCNGYGISTNAFPSSVTYWCEINTDMKASITIIDNVDENLSIFDNDPSLLSSTKVCEFDKSGKESVEVDKLISSSSTNNIPENDLSKLPSRRNAKQKLNGRNKYKRQNYFDSHDRAVKKIPKFGRKKTRDKGFRHVKKNSIGSDTVSTMCEEQKIKNDEKCDESSTVTKSNRMQKIERTILETLPPSSPTLKVKCNSFSTDCEHGVILKTSDLSINTPKDCDKFVLQNQVPDKLIPNLHSFVSTEFAVSSTLVPEKSKLGNYLLKRMCTVIDDSMQDHSIIFL
uniref:Uncharacterized protein n=1 Tax=Corethron hystrix TaxID=216773 RepID=A0A7S1C118_9STRA|mmetsp:Transcript_9871/g.22023  ORF Transcript_9871/g.22023 Transcript_9871/m.22023 type:complete len:563 (+) Transcript_9871:971-2659(+)